MTSKPARSPFRSTSALPAAVLACALLAQGCAFHSTARQWNGRVGAEGDPVYLKSTTNVGVNLFVVITLFGSTDVPGMVDELTGEIRNEGGDRVRIIQSESENYWYGFPPFTWILTPVVTSVAADYVPSGDTLIDDRDNGRRDDYVSEEAEGESEDDASDAEPTGDGPDGDGPTGDGPI